MGFMGRDMVIDETLKFDKRVAEMLIRWGKMSRSELAEYLQKLEDVSEKAETVRIALEKETDAKDGNKPT
jgi:hypothetical protein